MVCPVLTYTGLLHYYHLSMQSGTEYLVRDHLPTTPLYIEYPTLGRGVDGEGVGIVTVGITLQHLNEIIHLHGIT